MDTVPGSQQGPFGCGDCLLILNILPENLAGNLFNVVNDEVSWSEMTLKGSPVPRLVCIQGELTADLVEPVYRHPADSQPQLTAWTENIQVIRDIISDRVYPDLNHALIQLYRSGDDNISEHSDKTLDIKRGTGIFTLSLGAKRTLILRSKEKRNDSSPATNSGCHLTRDIQRISLPHNSLFILGCETNKLYRHSIKADKRSLTLKDHDESAAEGQRISITLRSIATFYDRSTGCLFGQGAPKHPSQTESDGDSIRYCSAIQSYSNDGDEATGSECSRLISAFSAENAQTDFDWDLHYGKGFQVLNRTI